MKRLRAFTVFEVLAVCAVLGVLGAIAVIPTYRSYQAARAAGDAAQTLAQDISFAERVAQNSGPFEGATIEIISANPLVYECYHGRPSAIDPRSSLGDLLVRRSYDNVQLAGGPIDATTPLLFASNGSAQFEQADGTWPEQHQTIHIVLAPTGDASRAIVVGLDLFTGTVSLP